MSVLLLDGSLLFKAVYFDGMLAAELYELLDRNGLTGILLNAQGEQVPLGAPVAAGDAYIFQEKQLKSEPKDDAWFLAHAKLGSPSEFANSLAEMTNALGTAQPMYHTGRTSASPVPLPLANESFGCYVKNLNTCVVDAVDWRFVYESMAMSDFYPHQRQRRNVFVQVLERYLVSKLPDLDLQVTPSSESDTFQVEAMVAGECISVLLVVVKPELGLCGEPSVEVMKFYADHSVAARKTCHWTFFRSCCPMFILEIVGATIRVGGAAFFDKPAHQPFTPYLNIHRFLQDEHHLEQLSKALASIGAALPSLVSFYANVKQQQGQHFPWVRDPTISWPELIREEHRQDATVTQYSVPIPASHHQQHKERENILLFSLLRPASKRIVKFCQRYGVEVHQKWAALGYAPSFSCKELDGKWLAVDMEYLHKSEGWRLLLALDPRLFDSGKPASFNMYRLPPAEWEACKVAVKSAYLAVHAAYPTHVHGDLRRQNILYNVQTYRVAFIDFDWAGLEGRELYPLLVNPGVSWPAGVGSCLPIRCEHDIACLDMALGV